MTKLMWLIIFAFIALVGIGSAVDTWKVFFILHPARDARCDTAARYEAMREGANCT